MILEIKKWCEGIIVAVVLCIIIESLVPECNNKKYIKVIIGIYILYISLNPILNLLDYDFKFDLFEKYEKVKEVSNLQDYNIKDVYIKGIEQSIKKEIEELGYNIDYIKVFVDLNYENIERIELNIKNEKDILNYDEIFKYITQNYQVNIDNIIIN